MGNIKKALKKDAVGTLNVAKSIGRVARTAGQTAKFLGETGAEYVKYVEAPKVKQALSTRRLQSNLQRTGETIKALPELIPSYLKYQKLRSQGFPSTSKKTNSTIAVRTTPRKKI